MTLLLEAIGSDLVTEHELNLLTPHQSEMLAAIRRWKTFKNAARNTGRGEKAIQMTILRVRRLGIEP